MVELFGKDWEVWPIGEVGHWGWGFEVSEDWDIPSEALSDPIHLKTKT